MEKSEGLNSKRLKLESVFIILLCVLVMVTMLYVLLFTYKPNQNALGALGTVCMDTVGLILLLIIIANLAFGSSKPSQTTRLFLGLLIGTTIGLYFDFLTWASDGSLVYGGKTYFYTVSSLCTASIVACFFVMYLGSYLDDMYDLKNAFLVSKICMFWDLFAFLITVSLVIANKAFIFVDGHYETGVLYDVVTILPVLSLVVMAAYVVLHTKVIGKHDLGAVVGYIFIMIGGAGIEEIYRVGATYVSIMIADVFIFVMLQNKLIDKVRKQKDRLAEKMSSQYEILESMAGIYYYVNYIDFIKMTAKRFDMESEEEQLNIIEDPHSELDKQLYEGIDEEMKEVFWSYTDLSTLTERMLGEKIITTDFKHKDEGWLRAQYIRIGDSVDMPAQRFIFAIRNINEEKKNVEKWIKRSNTDEMTRFYNRHAYESDIDTLYSNDDSDNLVYVSIDINGLKLVNDTMGHEAGDELIIGTADCIRQCYGSYGRLYRIGGDEFAAIIHADEATLNTIKKNIETVTSKWHGNFNDTVRISCGYAVRREDPEMNIRDMAIVADKRMYDIKAKYYQKKGIDRRGQRDAHVALCSLYTKILRVNITEDTYQIVDVDERELTKEKGFSEKLSKWLCDFGISGQVHADDLEEYLAKTDFEYMSKRLENNVSSISIIYRRKYDDGFKRVMMELIPANDYSVDAKNLFLYVKAIE